MAKNKRLQVLFCGNDAMFDGLCLCILSILRRTKNPIDFYLLTGDLTSYKSKFTSLSKRHNVQLKKIVSEYGNKSTLTVFDCGELYKNKMQNNKVRMRKWTPYTLFRLLINELGLRGIVLYLDVDILVGKDIKGAFEEDMNGYELCVCHDTPKADWNNGTYFNAGSLLINVDYCRKTKLFEKAFQYCIDTNPKQLDQSALNYCRTKLKFWKNEYHFNCQPDCDQNGATIYHFCGKEAKPWDVPRFQKKLWRHGCHIWDKDYEIFNSLKSKQSYK